MLALALLLPAALDHHEKGETAGPPDGFVSVFDGKTLDGWTQTENKTFEVRDGMIVAQGKRSHLFHGKKLTDFTFRCDIKCEPGSNSGVFFHTEFQEEGWPLKGAEVQVNNTHGDPIKGGSIYKAVNRPDSGVKDGAWYTQEITVRGDSVTVAINGTPLYTYLQPACASGRGTFGDGGVLALQAHDPGSTVYYKNLFLKDLSGE